MYNIDYQLVMLYNVTQEKMTFEMILNGRNDIFGHDYSSNIKEINSH